MWNGCRSPVPRFLYGQSGDRRRPISAPVFAGSVDVFA